MGRQRPLHRSSHHTAAFLRQKAAQKSRHHFRPCTASESILPAEAPVVHQSPLAEGVALDHLADA